MRRLWPLVILFFVVGCGGASHRVADEYTGCGGDEQYLLLEDNELLATIDDTSAPEMTQPTSGATVPFTPKVVVQWNIDAVEPGAPDGDVPYMDGPTCQGCCPQWNAGALTTLHLPPESGDIYDVHLHVDGEYIWRLVTTLQEWTPSDALWSRLRGKTVTLTIYRLAILRNDPKEGPFVASKPFSFSVQP
jgi:hypothetical protein